MDAEAVRQEQGDAGRDGRRIADVLRKGRWYKELPEDLQSRIVACSRVREFAKGEVISLEGSPVAGLAAVLSGQVKLVRQARLGHEALLYICEPGFWFAEYAALTGERAIVTAIARSRSRLLVLPNAAIQQMIGKDHACFRYFAMLVIARIPTYLKAFVHASSLEPDARLRGQLALLAEMKVRELCASAPVDLPYSQSDLASLIGLSRQTTNQLVKTLAEKGQIEPGFRSVRVLSPEKLLDCL